MITGFFAALLAGLYIYLAARIIGLRGQHKVSLGSGGHVDLDRAIRAHGNLAEYAPIFLVLLLILEMHGVSDIIIAALGLVFLGGRLAHAWAFQQNDAKAHFVWRVGGMRATLAAMGLAAIALIILTVMAVFGI